MILCTGWFSNMMIADCVMLKFPNDLIKHSLYFCNVNNLWQKVDPEPLLHANAITLFAPLD